MLNFLSIKTFRFSDVQKISKPVRFFDISSHIPLKDALKEVRIEGVGGILEFDQNRETHAEMKFVKMEKDGSLVVE